MHSSLTRQGALRAPGVLFALLLAIVSSSTCGNSGPQQAPAPSTPLVPLAPKGLVAYPFTFSWSGAAPADVVRVTVVDAAERQLMEFDARGTSVAMPPRLAELIRPGEHFSWKVAAFDDAAQPVRGSGWVEATREK